MIPMILQHMLLTVLVLVPMFRTQDMHGYWTRVSAMPVPASSYVATLLQDGRVLITGGEPGIDDLPQPAAQIYAPATQRWSVAQDMNVARIRLRYCGTAGC